MTLQSEGTRGLGAKPLGGKGWAPPLEALVTHPLAFGLTTATNTQRAICRAIDGRALGVLADDPDVQTAFGGPEAIAALPVGVLPAEFILVAAIRGAKTLITAAHAFKSCLTVDLGLTRRNEVVRYSIAATDKDKALVALEHLQGTIPDAPLLRPFFVRATKSGVIIRHPSGRPIEIRVIVAGRGGQGVISRYSAGLTCDEAARMQGEGRVVNLPDLLRAVHGRLLPGAQVLMVGSPWAPMGPVFEAVQNDHGKPRAGRVVARATGPMLNPFWWTKERIEAELKKPDGRLTVQTDCWAQFGDLPTQFFTGTEIDQASRETFDPIVDDDYLKWSLPYDKRKFYIAYMDPATRGNAWTLVIVGCLIGNTDDDTTYEVALAKEWIGTSENPLDARVIFREMAPLLEAYGSPDVWSDQHNFDSNRGHADTVGINLLLDEDVEVKKVDRHLFYKELVTQDASTVAQFYSNLAPQKKRVSLPKIAIFKTDMLLIKKVLTPAGMKFPLPVTPDGRHADFVPATIGAIGKAMEGSGGWEAAMRRRLYNSPSPTAPKRTEEKPDETDPSVVRANLPVGLRLKAARLLADLTCDQLAAKTGEESWYIQRVEAGLQNVGDMYVSAMLAACGLPPTWYPPRG